ncbi:hypothetical protein QBC37DRAFT_434778 [Rhypophila decipiens]|uniref:Zn(2)-C6 fungal-type domain-containing protein n=1 Tax=Rhypophila decipiens TaxID=261697 RepID=A0AAN6XTX8_9PEZI|nr:hypothetical protein QBC37DRAFT_434778 [Rhypophila decipiens]
MVGVPGRSKACHNCRQRRIKCGGEVPTCRNCTKSRRTCAGYQRQHAFILSKEMTEVSSSETGDSGGRVMISRYQNKPPDGTPKSKTNPADASQIATVIPPQEMPLHNVFRDRLFAILVEKQLATVAPDSVQIPFTQRNDLMLQVVSLPDLSPALENTLLAVYLARLGREHKLPSLVHASLGLYTRGMSAMRKEIRYPSSQYSDQNLAASLALLLYEITECPGGTLQGYMAHYRGTMQLLRMRGAGAHASGIAHSAFHILRLHTVLPDMSENKRSFLADPEWRELPWSCPNGKRIAKTPFDCLIDILLDIPEIGPKRQKVEAMTDPKRILSGCIANINEGYALESRLAEWFDSYKETIPGGLYHPKLTTVDSVVDDVERGKLFPVAFHFPAFMVGQNLVYYWVGLMSVQAHLSFSYTTLEQLMAVLDAMGRDSLSCSCITDNASPEAGNLKSLRCLGHFNINMLPTLGHREEWPRTTAYNICQSTEYFLEDKIQGFMPASVLPALVLVKGFWKFAPGNMSREIAWIDDMLGKISASGSAVAGVIRGLG